MSKITWEMKGKNALEAMVNGRKFEIKKQRGDYAILVNGREVAGASNMPMALQLAEMMVEPQI